MKVNTFGSFLAECLADARISQSKLGRKAGLDHSYVSRLIGGTREPSREAVIKLAESLKLEGEKQDTFFILAGFTPPNAPKPISLQELKDLDTLYPHVSPDLQTDIRVMVRLALRIGRREMLT